ncbi:MAG: hypothetical protein OXB95_12125, partial [Rhodobacteraceae bacterium]|nr:hypothetical protein [Paracoccaceae bacterium]
PAGDTAHSWSDVRRAGIAERQTGADSCRCLLAQRLVPTKEVRKTANSSFGLVPVTGQDTSAMLWNSSLDPG